jgi:hypothetical protein
MILVTAHSLIVRLDAPARTIQWKSSRYRLALAREWANARVRDLPNTPEETAQ